MQARGRKEVTESKANTKIIGLNDCFEVGKENPKIMDWYSPTAIMCL